VTNILLYVQAGVTKVSLAGEAPIQIVGNGENNEFVGNAGANGFFPGSGNDTLNGGAGDDTFGLNGGGGTADGGRGSDTIQSNDLGTYSLSHVETLDVNSTGSVYASAAQLASFSTITDSLSAANTTITLRLTGAGGKVNLLPVVAGAHAVEVFANDATSGVRVIATARGDTLLGSAFDDTLFGGDGNDLFFVSGGTDLLSGDGGNDTFRIYYGGSGSLKGGDGTDTVQSNDLGTFSLHEVEILDTNGFNQVYATVAQLSSFGTITDSVVVADSQIEFFLRGAGGTINLQRRVAGAHSAYVVDAGLTSAATVKGSDSDDFMIASANLNGLRGKGGDDTFRVDYGGSGTVVGGDGIDTVQSNNLGSFSLHEVEILDTNGFNQV
jgi:Ca2+-binding RTX toxin-like protein